MRCSKKRRTVLRTDYSFAPLQVAQVVGGIMSMQPVHGLFSYNTSRLSAGRWGALKTQQPPETWPRDATIGSMRQTHEQNVGQARHFRACLVS